MIQRSLGSEEGDKMRTDLDVTVLGADVRHARHLAVLCVHQLLNALHLDVLGRQNALQIIDETGLVPFCHVS